MRVPSLLASVLHAASTASRFCFFAADAAAIANRALPAAFQSHYDTIAAKRRAFEPGKRRLIRIFRVVSHRLTVWS